MTNNHLYWTVTTILQEQSGTRRAEIVKHMIKIASVSSCFLSLSILLSYYIVLLLLMTFSFIWVFSCRILKRLKKFQYNVCHTKVRTCIQAYICNSVLYRFVYVCCVCVCVCTYIYACDFLFLQWIKSFVSTKIKTNMGKGSWKVSQDKKGA